jgi:hypothetical protein
MREVDRVYRPRWRSVPRKSRSVSSCASSAVVAIMKADVTVMSTVEIGCAVSAPGLFHVDGDRRLVLKVLQLENARLRDQAVDLSLQIQGLREMPNFPEKTIVHLFSRESYQRGSRSKRS